MSGATASQQQIVIDVDGRRQVRGLNDPFAQIRKPLGRLTVVPFSASEY